MSSLFPLRSEQPPQPTEATRVVDIGDSEADRIVEALAAGTTREILLALYEEPAPATEIAERVDTSLQNVDYHLDKLQTAGLIEVGDSWYAEGGNEMNVYVPTAKALVLLAGDESTRQTIRETLTQVMGTAAAVGIAGLLVDRLVALPARGIDTMRRVAEEDTAAESADVAESAAEPSLLPLAELGGLLTPGMVFALGGLFAIAVVLMIVAVRRYRAG
ncbi:MAG: putative transcriptional regulator [Halonotius sp. J07HN4]|nr:MAG: putative transcriptional regulator [Halonotius sp. J07HN4]